jgi:DMSO reductase anchor subunit
MAETTISVQQLCSQAGLQNFHAAIAKEAATVPQLAALSEVQLIALGLPALRARKLLSLCHTFREEELPTTKVRLTIQH